MIRGSDAVDEVAGSGREGGIGDMKRERNS